ncbi:MAG: hypothetical protein AB4911_03290 [Oscillochloridaceae bacterium umkhey_bin13]
MITRRVLISGTVGGSANLLAARIELLGAQLGVVRTIGAALRTPDAVTGQGPAAYTGQQWASLNETAPQQPTLPPLPPLPPRTISIPLLLIGFTLFSLVLLRVVPRALLTPARLLATRPARALLVGLLTG